MGDIDLNKIVKELEYAAYKRGWSDAIAAVQKAAESVSSLGAKEVPQQALTQPTMPLFGIERHKGNPYRANTDMARVFDYLMSNEGQTGVQIIEGLRQIAPIEERTVRTALHRMKKKAEAVNRDGKWYAGFMA